ncbi:hypothetical protein C6P77_15970 [Burkholderia ambifaria]|nr:hypothetical protein C6P77_15970 [Burkholderia ambifaria]
MPVSRLPRVARAGAPVVAHDDRPAAVLLFIFIPFPRMGQVVRAGQLDADSSSTVQGRIDRAGKTPAPARLIRTTVGRIIGKIFDR